MYKFLFVLCLAFVAISALPADKPEGAPKDLDTAQQFLYGYPGYSAYGYGHYPYYSGYYGAYSPYYRGGLVYV